VFIKDKTKAASRMSAGINFVKLLWEANKKNSVLEELRVERLAVIQKDMC